MNKEIETLLKLERIPNFRLSNKQKAILDEWKSSQKPIEIIPKKTRRKKTTNEVKVEQNFLQ